MTRPKTLADRQKAALAPSARLADVETVLADTREALPAVEAEFALWRDKSLDPSASTEAARAARTKADDAAHDRDRQLAAIEALEAKAEQMKADAAVAARIAIYDEAKAERDQLADDIRDRWPALQAEMVGLLERMAANDTRVDQANRQLPKGRARLEPAECVAREMGLTFMTRLGQVGSLKAINLPDFHGVEARSAWPRMF